MRLHLKHILIASCLWATVACNDKEPTNEPSSHAWIDDLTETRWAAQSNPYSDPRFLLVSSLEFDDTVFCLSSETLYYDDSVAKWSVDGLCYRYAHNLGAAYRDTTMKQLKYRFRLTDDSTMLRTSYDTTFRSSDHTVLQIDSTTITLRRTH